MIHSTAIVSPKARLGERVSVGPYSIIEDNVEIGDDTWIGPHVVINGHTTIGKQNKIFQFCSVGEVPQDKKYAGEPTRLVIGDRNTIHEFCSLHIGTVQDTGVTVVGNDNWIMAYVHVAHDCVVGNNTILANNVNLAGHVIVGDWAILGGFTGVHQFTKVGAHSFCGVGTVLTQDLPPYVTVAGNPASPHGINAEGLKRRGFSPDSILAIKRAYKALYRQGLPLAEAKAAIEEIAAQTQEVDAFSRFLAESARGIVR